MKTNKTPINEGLTRRQIKSGIQTQIKPSAPPPAPTPKKNDCPQVNEEICGTKPPIKHLWGDETTICQVKLKEENGQITGYTGKELIVYPNGNASSIHFHLKKTETFYIERGHLELEIYHPINPKSLAWNGFSQTTPTLNPTIPTKYKVELNYRVLLNCNMTIIINPMVPHRFFAKEKLVIIKEFSTWDDPKDSYRILLAGPHEKT